DRLLAELQNPTRRDLAAKVRQGADIYKKTFLEVVDVINTRNDIITNRMDVIGPRLADAIEEAKLNNKALQDDLGPRATQEVYQANLINRIVAFAAIIIGVALAWLTAKATSGPIVRMTSAMGDLAQGNLEVDIPARGRKDEIGKMADAVQTFKDAAIAKRAMEEKENNREKLEEERLAREAEKEAQAKQVKFVVTSMARGLNQFAEGDLTVQLEEEFAEEFDALRVDFNNSILQINQTLLKIRTGAQSIDVKSGAIRDSADSLSRRTESQAASLEETSAALEEITATVGETSAQATEASQVAQKAQTDTNESSEVVSKAISAMERIENASSEISTIISVIDEIAFQTNLLAL
ncbi:MAG: HAMP domain-containing protein, partial [Pseudomonadota bacterium]